MADFPGGFTTVVTALQNIATNLGALTKQIASSTSSVFPQVNSTATSAVAGSATLPAAPAGFIQVTLPNGTTAKVPFYN